MKNLKSGAFLLPGKGGKQHEKKIRFGCLPGLRKSI